MTPILDMQHVAYALCNASGALRGCSSVPPSDRSSRPGSAVPTISPYRSHDL